MESGAIELLLDFLWNDGPASTCAGYSLYKATFTNNREYYFIFYSDQESSWPAFEEKCSSDRIGTALIQFMKENTTPTSREVKFISKVIDKFKINLKKLNIWRN